MVNSCDLFNINKHQRIIRHFRKVSNMKSRVQNKQTKKPTDEIGSKENIQKSFSHYIHELRKISYNF